MKQKKYVTKRLDTIQNGRMMVLTALACEHYAADMSNVMAGRQTGICPEVRHICIYLAVKYNVCSKSQISAYYKRNRSLINKAIDKINAMLYIADPAVLAALPAIEKNFILTNKIKQTKMEVLTVTNGIVQVVLVPQNQQECETLRRLLDEGPLEVAAVSGNLNILGIPLQDGIIIRQKQKEVSNASN